MSPFRKLLVATLVVVIIFAVAGSKPASAGGTISHIVKRGETLYSISRSYGVAISCWGLANPDRIYPGQVLTCNDSTGGSQNYSSTSEPAVGRNVNLFVHTVRRGETLYSISLAYGVSVSCWGVPNPNRIYEGQILTCGEGYIESAEPYIQQVYQAPAQQPSQQNYATQSAVSTGQMPNWLAQDISLGGTWWCVLRDATWYISRTSSGSNMMTYDDTNHICSGYAGTTQISGQTVPVLSPSVAQPIQQVSGTDWNSAVSKVENRVFETKQQAAEWLASIYRGASSAYQSFLETNGVNILIGTASAGGAIWLVKAAAGLSQGPLLTATVVAFGVMVIFAIVEYVIAYIRR